ncbi:hypothetical protein PAPYR_765 [Paratrimastix pyriformis]|uniref:Uncharacterized protein n=1 Tax=Paratrimastix pyriformis TaxID=342808 RepID=A0ABQ8UUE9_9EUKA|nr:hypothetical protein PAPYR_765 [Paratrimastix pyriformis]
MDKSAQDQITDCPIWAGCVWIDLTAAQRTCSASCEPGRLPSSAALLRGTFPTVGGVLPGHFFGMACSFIREAVNEFLLALPCCKTPRADVIRRYHESFRPLITYEDDTIGKKFSQLHKNKSIRSSATKKINQKAEELKSQGMRAGETLVAFALRTAIPQAAASSRPPKQQAPQRTAAAQLTRYDRQRLRAKATTPKFRWRRTILSGSGPVEYAVGAILALRTFRRDSTLSWGSTPRVIDAAKVLFIEQGREQVPRFPRATTLRESDIVMDGLQLQLHAEGPACFCTLLTDNGTFTSRQAMHTGKGFLVVLITSVSGSITGEATSLLTALDEHRVPDQWKMPDVPPEEQQGSDAKNKEDDEVSRNIHNSSAFNALAKPQTYAADMAFLGKEDATTIADRLEEVLGRAGAKKVIWGMGDGASTNTGTVNGLWALMRRRTNMTIYPIICISHTIDNAAKNSGIERIRDGMKTDGVVEDHQSTFNVGEMGFASERLFLDEQIQQTGFDRAWAIGLAAAFAATAGKTRRPVRLAGQLGAPRVAPSSAGEAVFGVGVSASKGRSVSIGTFSQRLRLILVIRAHRLILFRTKRRSASSSASQAVCCLFGLCWNAFIVRFYSPQTSGSLDCDLLTDDLGSMDD